MKGHQIIGELRPSDKYSFNLAAALKGHQIIGELRLLHQVLEHLYFQLKGHQIIGELRPSDKYSFNLAAALKGHQIIGELRLSFQHQLKKTRVIEGSPDHW